MQKDQPRRIAEYNSGSPSEVRDLSPSSDQSRKDTFPKHKPFKQVDSLKLSRHAQMILVDVTQTACPPSPHLSVPDVPVYSLMAMLDDI